MLSHQMKQLRMAGVVRNMGSLLSALPAGSSSIDPASATRHSCRTAAAQLLRSERL